ncbi:hypothetical protein ACS0TY_000306 [Phlomoides rotata]
MAPSTLVGPPEIYRAAVSATAATTPIPTSGDPLVDLLVENYNNIAGQKIPPMGRTHNNSPTFLSTGNPCLDFFFHVVPNTPVEDLNSLLKGAWDHDPLKALKLVGNLRGVRGTGKSDREGFYTAALWLHKNHPRTLASNVASFAELGYFKDLLEILFRLLEGPNARAVEAQRRKGEKPPRRQRRSCNYSDYESDYGGSDYSRSSKPSVYGRRRRRLGAKVVDRQLSREERRIEKAKKVVDKFNSDPDFKFLHECVSDVFARCLRSDMEVLGSGDLGKISTAAKWCPSLDSEFDRVTLLCETIAKKVFPREEYSEYEGVEEAHYAYRVRDRLRKQVLVPLRKATQLPEVYMEANDWGSIPYEKVASDAMLTHKEKFLKHDKKRFNEYLARVKSGEAKIASGALLPHEIIAALDDDPVVELQWKRMVEEMGKMENCVAICDVSANMEGIPMEASLALGVLLSELSQGPWKGKLITFSDDPKLHLVGGESLREKMEFVRGIKRCNHDKNLQKVFDVLLKVAVKGKLRGEEMVKRVFVFSDMGFGKSSSQRCYYEDFGTDYEYIERKFRENGYGDCVPEMVFWNLSNSFARLDHGYQVGVRKATPVVWNQAGVALVSGYSKNMMSLFSGENRATLDPEAVMEAAISGEEYQRLLLVD